MSEHTSRLTLCVTATGINAADVADDALTQARDFFGEGAEVEIVSGEIQRHPSGADYSGSVIVRQAVSQPADTKET